MIRGVYDAGAALQAATLNQEVVAENLANSTTPGYRRQGLNFESLMDGNSLSSAQVASGAGYTSFDAGPMQQTGNPLDLALAGDAFFVLEGPHGPIYTRNGSFEVNSQGELTSHSGMKVRGQGGGSISVPQNTAQVLVARDGTIFADGSEVGRLDLARFDNPQTLRRVGPTLFEGASPGTFDPDSARVEQGYREGSNVRAVQEMISMMIGMRQYEAAERALRSIGDAVALNTKPQ